MAADLVKLLKKDYIHRKDAGIIFKEELLMIIQHNMSAMNTHRQLGFNTTNASKYMEKLSSGFRVNRAADDAAGLAISEKMRSQIRGMEQASRNAQDGISLVQVAEGALANVNDILVRVRELATQAANGTYDDGPNKDLARIQEEVEELAKQVDTVMNGTKFNGKALLNVSGGSATTTVSLQIGIENAADHKVSIDLTKISLAETSTGGSGISAFMGGIDLSSMGGAQAVLTNIEARIEEVAAARSYLGANQNRLEYTVNNLNVNVENTQAAESRIRDADMAKEMMNFTKFNILQQASQSMLAQANMLPQNVLQLLR